MVDSLITPNAFFKDLSITASSSTSTSEYLIYYIPGNPGLISYYHTYLSLLASNLSTPNTPNPPIEIAGYSLGGFETTITEPAASNSQYAKFGLPNVPEPKLYSLQSQIEHVEERLLQIVRGRAALKAKKSNRIKVILVGHSVGAYMAMELINRDRSKSSISAPSDFDIVGGVMLFPTVVDIAKSLSGQRLGLLLSLTHTAYILSLLTKLLVAILPSSLLKSIINIVMRSPPQEALETTVSLLTSKTGVREVLHMARDEMVEITDDKWTDEVWGINSSPSSPSPSSSTTTTPTRTQPPPSLHFYFGASDHWVANATRDTILASRGKHQSHVNTNDHESNGRSSQGPKMVVCEEGVPHGFCIRHSGIIAKKTAALVREIARY